MKIIAKGRQEGKTEELIKLSAEIQAPILCKTRIQKEIVKKKARMKKLSIPEPLCIDLRSLGFRERLSKYDSIIVDDADSLLQKILGVEISALSITLEKE